MKKRKVPSGGVKKAMWQAGLFCILSSLSVPLAAAETLLINDALVFDVRSGSASQKDVLVEDGRFVSVKDQIDKDKADKVVEAEGKALLPGLIDIHTHWTNMDGADRASIASDLLLAGVTTVTDFHTSPEAFQVKRAFHETIMSPHVFFTARMGVPYGHGLEWGDSNMTASVYGKEDAEEATRKIMRYKPDAIKVFADGWRYGYGVNQSSINANALEAIVGVANENGLPTFTHTVSVDGAKLAAKAGVSAIVHAVQDDVTDEDLIELLLDKEVFYAPTLVVYELRADKMAKITNPRTVEIMQKRQAFSRANLYRFNQEGIPVALGTDQGIDSTYFGEADLRELELFVDFGMSPSEALIAATLHGAQALGVGNDRGAIEEGMRADFILVNGRPWESVSDIRKTDQVYVDGVALVKSGKLVKPQGSGQPPSVKAKKKIDDFEGEDSLTAYDAARLLLRDKNFPRSQADFGKIERETGGSALHFSGEFAHKKQPFAYVLLPFSPEAFAPLDATSMKGVRFEVRGDGRFDARLSSVSGTALASFKANKNWKTVEFLFSDFKPDDNVEIDISKLSAIAFGRQGEANSEFWLELDSVEFF